MNSLSPIVFKPAHIELMEMRDYERRTLDIGMLDYMSKQGYCNTMIADGRVIFIAGFLPRWKGVIQVYIIPSIYVAQYGKSVVKKIRQYLDEIGRTFPDLARMETQSLADDQTDRWMATLGFRCEGTHEQWKDGMTYRTWACKVENGQRTCFS